MTTTTRSAVTTYAEDVISGRIIAGKKVRQACERHMRDLDVGHLRGLHFDEEAAQFAIDFFEILPLPDGEGAGDPFILQPWEAFVIGSLFGWIGPDGRRRFHYALVEVARSNGKSPLAGGLGLFALTADGEQGAQVYSAATTRDQAKIVFNDAVHMAEKSALWPRLTKTVNNLAFMRLNSYFRPLSADASTMDGLRVHVGIVDELHEHPDGEVMAKLRTGMKSTQPLLFAITTAGAKRQSVCWHEHDLATKILEGVLDNDDYFAYIATIDEDDDWRDESCWIKANPSLGVTVRVELLRAECLKAQQVISDQNDFLRFRMNVWTEQVTRWLSTELWDEGSIDSGAMSARPCYVGVVTSTEDLSAVILWFPDGEGGGDVVPFFFMPEENVAERARRDSVPLDRWAAEGWLELTGGNVTDYDLLRRRLNDYATVFDIKEVAVRSHNTVQLMAQLEGDGFTVVSISPGYVGMSEATKELERQLVGRKFRHGGHPVLRWMVSNAAVRQDADGEKRPNREASGDVIYGVEALIMAIGRAMVHPEDEPSMYETEPLSWL